MRIYEIERQKLIGQTFRKLTILGFQGPKAICKCECGNISSPWLSTIKNGKVISCGCHRQALIESGQAHYIHGHGKGSKSTPTHNAWIHIRQRCENPKNAAYHNYGGRGIKVCERWQNFENFLEDMGIKPPRTSIERINNEMGYQPDNCIWAGAKIQARNRRTSRYVTAFGETKTLIEWTEDTRCVVQYATLSSRLSKGWQAETAITTIPRF